MYLLNNISKTNNFSIEKERSSLINIKNNPHDVNLRNTFVEQNLGFVIKIARKYSINYNIPIEDLISEGSIGLIDAIHDFDLDKNKRFTTYAYFHIIQKIMELIQKYSTVISFPNGTLHRTKGKSLFRNTKYYLEINDVKLTASRFLLPEDFLIRKELLLRLQKSLNRLSDRERQIIYLRFNENYTYKDIAKILHLSSQRIHMLEQDITKKLKRYFYYKLS